MQQSTQSCPIEAQIVGGGSHATILVVDDQIQECRRLEDLLAAAGYRTVCAGNAAEVLEALAEYTPSLILLDTASPAVDRYELAALLKSAPVAIDIPIILLVASLDHLPAPADPDAEPEDFLIKPINQAELRLRIRNRLQIKELSDFKEHHLSILEQQVLTRTAELLRFRTALDTTGDGIFLVNRTTMHYIDANSTASAMLGYSREELMELGPAQTSLVAVEQWERVYDAVIAKHPTSELAEVELLCKDRSLLLVEARRQAYRHGADWLIVCVLRDITERTRAAVRLRESERRFSDLLSNVELISLMLDREASITYCNDYLLKLTGWRCEEVIGRDWFELFVPAETHRLRDTFFQGLLTNAPETLHHENEILTRSGERRLIRWNNSVLRNDTGEVIGTASIGEDITASKQAQMRIQHLNRVYAMLSGITKLIVRVRDRDELYREACRIAVRDGGFLMSLITLADKERLQVPVASAGKDQDLLAAIRNLLSSTADAANTLVVQAIEKKAVMVSNDSQSDPRVLLGGRYAEFGIHSLVILPLIVLDEAVGVLALYAGEIDFFHEAELKLLTELASDIAFAMDYIGKQDRLEYLAYHDELTGLANRICFSERVTRHLRTINGSGHKLAVILLDVERFKNVNDSLGRATGDALLKQVAEWLIRDTGDAELLARVGADHFALVLPEVNDKAEVARFVEKMLESFINHPFPLNATEFRLAFKAGIALAPDDGDNANTILDRAEAALKKAKAGGDRYLFHTQEMTEAVAGRLLLENMLRQAVDNEEFVLHYQPKINIGTGALSGVEALIRWNDPRSGLVLPSHFIPLLEETGLIHDVGRWALRKAIEDGRRWRDGGWAAVRIAVNVSPRQLRSRGFIDEIRRAVDADHDTAASLELEITESLIMDDVEHNIATMAAICAMGVKIAIDDFGTGFSSLSYLAKLPVNTLKIDRSFVVEMTLTPQGLALVSTIIGLAHSLKLNVVAEGVETAEQLRLLQLLRCDEAQGFLFAKPLSSEIFEARYLVQSAASGQADSGAAIV